MVICFFYMRENATVNLTTIPILFENHCFALSVRLMGPRREDNRRGVHASGLLRHYSSCAYP